jgi:hypothetical protein
MKMHSKPGVPRTPVPAAGQGPQFDIEKIEVGEVLAPQVAPLPKPISLDDDENFERIPPPAPRKEERPVSRPPTRVSATPPRPVKVDPLLAEIPNSLIEDLEAEFGLRPEEVLTASLSAGDKTLVVEYRRMNYDDLMWALGKAHAKEKSEVDEGTGMLEEVQKNQLYRHYTTCRCLTKIRDQYVWDLLGLTESIQAAVPNWNGTSVMAIPDVFVNRMALAMFDLFRRRLHPDLLMGLDAATHSQPFRGEEVDEEEDAEDPTEAT